MVDVSAKAVTERIAIAEGQVVMQRETLALCLSGQAKKGDVFATARIAGILAAKKTHELIPLCHPLQLLNISVDLIADESLPGFYVAGKKKLGSTRSAQVSYVHPAGRAPAASPTGGTGR